MTPFTESAWIPSSAILQEERVTRLLGEGHTVDMVYLDFAKAFDSVYHQFSSQAEVFLHRWSRAVLD